MQNPEGLGNAGLGNVLALDDGLVGLHTATTSSDFTVRISCRV